MVRPILLSAILFALTAGGTALLIERQATAREAEITARHPPTGQFVQVDSRDVHVVVTGTGPDLVLIHGAGGSSRDFTVGLVNKLKDKYRVFAVDRPGFGWSERQSEMLEGALTVEAESPIQQARHLAEAVRQLGARRPIVLGHSYGAAVAMGWGLEESAAGLVIVSGATMPWPGEIDWTYRVLGSVTGGALLPRLITAAISRQYVSNTLESVFQPQDPPDNYLLNAGVMMATRTATLRANARQVKALRPHVVEMSSRYSEIHLPVEILHGTADKTVYPEIHAEPLAKLVPDAQLTLLEDIGHMPHHAVPDDIIAAIDRIATRAGLR